MIRKTMRGVSYRIEPKLFSSRIVEIFLDWATYKYPLMYLESAYATEEEKCQYHLDRNDSHGYITMDMAFKIDLVVRKNISDERYADYARCLREKQGF